MEPVAIFEPLKRHYPEAVQETRHCHVHGEYRALRLRPGAEFSDCPGCRLEETDRIDRMSAKERKESELQARLEKEIPKRFQAKTFENYSVDMNPQARDVRNAVRNYAENFQDNLACGRSLMLIGNPGTGKNHLAMSLVRAILKKGFSARILDASDLVYRVKSTWDRQARETEGEVIRELSKLDLLVINELGALFRTETEKRILFKVINRRYEDQLPTVIIGNVTRDEAKAILGLPAYDRLKEDGGQVLVLDWESYRQEATA